MSLFNPVPGGTYSNDWGFARSGGRSHQGTDIFGSVGTPVYAAFSGYIGGSFDSGVQPGMLGIRVAADDGRHYFYNHLDPRMKIVQPGQYVQAGQVIGYIGNPSSYGYGFAPHLHFSINEGRSGTTNPYFELTGAAAPPQQVGRGQPSGSMVTYGTWAGLFLERLGAPATPENTALVIAWMQKEGTAARWNPLATTQGALGASQFNSVGVKNYPDIWTGLDATVRTILNGRYNTIVAGLRSGNTQMALNAIPEWNTWGSGDIRSIYASTLSRLGEIQGKGFRAGGVAEMDPLFGIEQTDPEPIRPPDWGFVDLLRSDIGFTPEEEDFFETGNPQALGGNPDPTAPFDKKLARAGSILNEVL